MLNFAISIVGATPRDLFERFWRQLSKQIRSQWNVCLPRRYTVTLPSYSMELLLTVRRVVRQLITGLTLPQAAKDSIKT